MQLPAIHADHLVFTSSCTTSVPATFTLEITNGRLSGDYGATSTPGKVLDHETSTYFGVTDWREHPLYLRPTLGRVEKVEGTAISLTTRGCAINYYHFLYDSIARLGVLESSCPGAEIDAYVVPHATRYQRQLLELAGITGTLIQPRRGLTVVADRLLVPSNPNWALQAPPDSVAWLRNRLRPSRSGGSPARLYLTRGSAPNTRRYCEEEELWPELERRGFDSGRSRERCPCRSRSTPSQTPRSSWHRTARDSPTSRSALPTSGCSRCSPRRTYTLGCGRSVRLSERSIATSSRTVRAAPTQESHDDVSIPVARVTSVIDELID